MKNLIKIIIIFLSIYMEVGMGGIIDKQIEQKTNGNGFFKLSLINNGDIDFDGDVRIGFCEVYDETGKKYSYEFYDMVSVQAGSTLDVMIPRPVIGGYDDCLKAGPKLKTGGMIMIIITPYEGNFGMVAQEKLYFTKYIDGTSIIDVPDTEFFVGYKKQLQNVENSMTDNIYNKFDLNAPTTYIVNKAGSRM